MLSPALRLRLAALLAAFFFAASPASASLVEALSLDALFATADHVVLGEVTELRVSKDTRGRIVTDANVRVIRRWKGTSSAGDTLTVRRLGGTLDGLTLQVIGEPAFEAGGRLILFGRRSPVGGHLRPVGMSQGVLHVDLSTPGGMVRPTGDGLSLVARDETGRLAPRPAAIAEPTPLDTLTTRLDALAGGAHAR